MARNEAEYRGLKQLQSALMNRGTHQKQLDMIDRNLNKLKKPQLYTSSYHQNCLKDTYAKPFRRPKRIQAVFTNIFMGALKTIGALLLCCVAIAPAVFADVFLFKWLWNISFHKMSMAGGDGSIYTAIHLFALAVIFAIPAIILIEKTGLWSAILGGIAGVLVVASVIFYWSHLGGVADFFLRLFAGVFAAIPHFFVALFAEIVFLLPIAIDIVVIVLIIIKLDIDWWDVSDSLWGHDYYQEPIIDYSPLYQTAEYLDAVAKDNEENEIKNKKYQNAIQIYETQVFALREKQTQLKTKITECEQTIRNSTFLHSDYRTIEWVNTILWYIEHNRAYNISEAMRAHDANVRDARRAEELKRIEEETRRTLAENQRANAAQMAQTAAMVEEALNELKKIEKQRNELEERRNEHLSDIRRDVKYASDDIYRYTRD